MTQHNRYNGLLPAPTCNGLAVEKLPTCYRLVADLSFMLQTCYGLVSNTMGESPTCYGLATGKLV